MKTVLLLALFLYAASAAPAEDKQEAPEAVAVAEAPEEQAAARGVSEEEAAPQSRFNPCPDGWFQHGSRCFMFVNSLMTWYNAEEHCNALGAHLASVTNPREYNFLQQITRTAGQSTAWLGGFSLQGRWMWIDREGFYYTNWSGQLSSTSYPCMYLRTTSGWGNQQCTSSSHRFICSKNPFGC